MVRDAIHRDLDRLEEWASRNQLKFIKDKHQFLLLNRKLWYKDTDWSLPGWMANKEKKAFKYLGIV